MLDERHGALVKPDDPAALAQALEPLIMDPMRRLSAGQAVKALANSIPNWQAIARMTEAVYARALAK